MALTSNLLKRVLGVEGLTFQDLKDETYRKRFSHYLPWVTYDPETKVYGCSDDSVGFIFECSPLAFAGEQTMETLEGLVRLNVPSGSVIQFTLLADPYIEPYLSAYKTLKTRDSDLTRASAERFTQFLAGGGKGSLSSTTSRYETFAWWYRQSCPQEARRSISTIRETRSSRS